MSRAVVVQGQIAWPGSITSVMCLTCGEPTSTTHVEAGVWKCGGFECCGGFEYCGRFVQHILEEQDERRRQESMWLLQAMNECAPPLHAHARTQPPHTRARVRAQHVLSLEWHTRANWG